MIALVDLGSNMNCIERIIATQYYEKKKSQ